MIRGRKPSLAKLKERGRRPQESPGNSRLAAMSARIDSARNSSLVRKPVFDGEFNVVAYEIVLGDGPITDIAVDDGSHRLVLNSAIELDLASVGDHKPVRLTVSASVIESVPPQLEPEQVMLVLGPEVDPSTTVVGALQDLCDKGFRILLDDLATNTQLHQLLRFSHAVRINLGLAGDPSFAKQIAVLRAADVQLIADGVGSYEEFRNATKLGFDQFQGSFLSRPDAFRKTGVSAEQFGSLELMTLLHNPDAEISDIAELIRRDVSLSYRILKVVNSAQYSLPRPLGSIDEAVMLVGTRRIAEWAGMMSMSGLADKPTELTRIAMVRARACETLGERLGRSDIQQFYLVGLFSVIEALLDVPAEQALRGLPLAAEIADAITSSGGIMGEVLRGVVAYEEGDWPHAHVIGLEDQDIRAAFYTAMLETDKAWSQIAG